MACRGAVVLCGYASPLYAPLERAGWERIDVPTACSAAGRTRGSGLQGTGAALAKVPRMESIWRNPQACVRSRGPLFESAAASHEHEEEGEDDQ